MDQAQIEQRRAAILARLIQTARELWTDLQAPMPADRRVAAYEGLASDLDAAYCHLASEALNWRPPGLASVDTAIRLARERRAGTSFMRTVLSFAKNGPRKGAKADRQPEAVLIDGRASVALNLANFANVLSGVALVCGNAEVEAEAHRIVADATALADRLTPEFAP